MWARVSEILLGLWLGVGYFFCLTSRVDLVAAAAMIVLAALSFVEKWNKMHLLQVLPAGYLLYAGYSAPCISAVVQNEILVAFFLLLFCIIPSHAMRPPRAWKKW